MEKHEAKHNCKVKHNFWLLPEGFVAIMDKDLDSLKIKYAAPMKHLYDDKSAIISILIIQSSVIGDPPKDPIWV